MPRAKKDNRGGYRAPAQPAAVSGPGAMSQRTDGGPAQPIRVAPGGAYGDRSASIAQQQAAPLRAGGPPSPAPPPAAPPAAAAGAPGGLPFDNNVFEPTQRPNEPLTAGVPMGPGSMGPPRLQTIGDLARAIFDQYPSDGLLDAIAEIEERTR